jgi:hypothetical protein
MKRVDLEHIIRASADIADDDEIIVLGSQSILAQFPNAPADLLVSTEADVYPKNHPERWELIDGSIGELSPFHSTFGYISKYVAGREKDRRFLRALASHGLAQRDLLLARLAATPIDEAGRDRIRKAIEQDFGPR